MTRSLISSLNCLDATWLTSHSPTAAGLVTWLMSRTHRVDTAFNMPNLTSVKRLIDLYEASDVFFMVLLIRYQVEDSNILVASVDFAPIEWIEWGCLTIGALGWGQVQIADSENVVVNPRQSRQQWMTQLCDALLRFYPGEVAKIQARIEFAKTSPRTLGSEVTQRLWTPRGSGSAR